MKRKITIIALMFMGLSSFLYYGLADADSPKYTIKLATVAPDGSSWMKVLEEMNTELKKKTGGEVGFRFYGGGRAGEEKAVLEKMRQGQYHSAGLTGLGLGEILPEIRVMEVPQMFKTYEEYDYVLKKMTKQFWLGIYKKGYVLLGWAEGGFINVFSKKRITSLDDLKAAKVWLRHGDPMLEGIYKGYDIKPVPLGLQDVLPMLQTGKIDTIGVSPLACIALQWHSEVKYRVNSPVYNIMAGVVVTKDAWRNLPKKHRRDLYKTVQKYSKTLTETSRKDNLSAEKKLEKIGIETITPTQEKLDEWNKKGSEIGDKLAGKLYSEKLLKKVRGYLKTFREKKKTN